MSQSLPTAYAPAEIEARWYESWERQGLFRARVDPDKTPYTIALPPPNVTGALHMGHAFEHTLQDAFARRARMMGFETLWMPGTDHAGIATQNVVERELSKEGLDRHEVGRDKFIERVWAWKEQYGGRILEQMRRLGNSCDWDRERFTMDEGLSRAVRTVFVRWYEDGLIYKGWRIINWCPRCGTALSDIEVEHEDVAGELVTFQYPLSDGDGYISVATTRVETMLGDTAVAVHPDDERYKALVGRTVRHPIFSERLLPIVADEAVDPEFGTGAVKVTPAHDPLDFEIGERHGLEKINILTGEAKTNEAAGPFKGLDRHEARRRVYARLEELGLIESREQPYVHPVGHCYRCHTEVEPWLSEQWFLKMKPLVGPAIAAVADGRIRMEPKRFVKSYTDWMENIRDWCISRQIWWGHRIPIWYCDDCGEVFAALEDPERCRECSSDSIHQDPDVLDTWFSSQLWPFSTLGWPDQTPDLDYFYPTTLMAPGYEILYLWVARMITSGLYFLDDVPFREVLIHGIVRDFEGKKMSKSLGNVIDPIDMIDRYGADALRFALAFGAVPGRDTNVSEDRIEGGRNFANKLWNASRFVLISIGEERPELAEDDDDLGIEERWILSRLESTTEEIERYLADYNWAEALRVLHRFTWSEFCDWYIELSKLKLNQENSEIAAATLVYVLDRILRLLHPIMPFVTEELFSKLRPDAGSIMTAPWPARERPRDTSVEETVSRMQDLITALRRLRTEHEIPPTKRINVRVAAHDFADEVSSFNESIRALARLDELVVVDSIPEAADQVVTITGARIEAAVQLGEVIDLETERTRLQRKIKELSDEAKRAEAKLSNRDFVAKAPTDVVERERQKLAEARDALQRVEQKLSALTSA